MLLTVRGAILQAECAAMKEPRMAGTLGVVGTDARCVRRVGSSRWFPGGMFTQRHCPGVDRVCVPGAQALADTLTCGTAWQVGACTIPVVDLKLVAGGKLLARVSVMTLAEVLTSARPRIALTAREAVLFMPGTYTTC